MVDPNTLIAVGLSHHTAPVQVREQLALDEAGVRETLARLTADGVASEAMLLSTCNRVELYTVSTHRDRIADYLPRGRSVGKYLYWHQGADAVRHLMKVACSLDSLVVGEPQILGQVKDAVRVAEEAHTLGRMLHPLTRRTLSVAKRVRTETEIGRSTVGIGNAGVELALQVFGGLEGKRALLVGVGEMGRQVAQALLGEGLHELIVTNRTEERAQELARACGGTAVPWDRLGDYLSRVDIAIAATAAREPVLTVPMVQRSLRERRYQPLFLVDLAVPRNVDPAVEGLEEAYLFNVDDLENVVAEGARARAEAARDAVAMVEGEAVKFVQSLAEIDVGAEIGRVTQRAEALRQLEIERSRRVLEALDPTQREAIDQMTRALVKKLLHGPIRDLRDAAKAGDESRVDAIARLWREEE